MQECSESAASLKDNCTSKNWGQLLQCSSLLTAKKNLVVLYDCVNAKQKHVNKKLQKICLHAVGEAVSCQASNY